MQEIDNGFILKWSHPHTTKDGLRGIYVLKNMAKLCELLRTTETKCILWASHLRPGVKDMNGLGPVFPTIQIGKTLVDWREDSGWGGQRKSLTSGHGYLRRG